VTATEMLYEAIYRLWRGYEKYTVWRMKRAKGGDVVIRESWVYRRECAAGYLGTITERKPQSKISRFFDLLLWYSPVGQVIVWRMKKSAW